MLLVYHIALVILSILNGINTKRSVQKFTWFGSAVCWLIICVSEIMELMQ